MQKTISFEEQAPDLERRLIGHLKKLAYEVTKAARLKGKSGIEHRFDLLATLDDGFARHTLAFKVSADTDKEDQLRTIFDFANAAFDTGIRSKVLVVAAPLDDEAKVLAQKQNISLADAASLKTTFASEPKRAAKHAHFKFESRRELLDRLSGSGYRLEEGAKLRGRSGAEYVFHILAYVEHGLVADSLGMDILDGEVNLQQVSLFDTKSFDVGLDHKALVITGSITAEAKQFAEHQRIRIIESRLAPPEKATGKDAIESLLKTGGKAESAAEKPLKSMPVADALQLIPEAMARRYNVVPLNISENTLNVAMADPNDIFAIEALSAHTKKKIKTMPASLDDVRAAIDFNYKAYGEISDQLSLVGIGSDAGDDKIAIREDAPLAQALNLIIDEAAKAGASDIHIEPEENRLRIRYRIDGVMQDTMSLPTNIHRALISRIKILGDMDIADHFHPQDGQFSGTFKDKQLDIRVAIAPTVHGEMSVMRLLDKSMPARGLPDLGMLPDSLETYKKLLKNPYGMILVSGPTGAGKTTTLYASIGSLETMTNNIITIEDPAEFRFKDINQIQVNVQAGITFASGLRSILRLDPDIIMVGEIRDKETAGIAAQSALTGHLVLSSIHANDSVGVLFRLLDLEVEDFLIASSVVGVVAQRMVRRNCPHCSRLMDAPAADQIAYEKETGESVRQFRYSAGCPACSYTGYAGRVGIFEILVISDKIRKMLTERASKVDIRKQALEDGMIPITRDGMRKVKAGITTPAEVLRATYTQE